MPGGVAGDRALLKAVSSMTIAPSLTSSSGLSRGLVKLVKLIDRNYDDLSRYVNMIDLKDRGTQQQAMEAFFFGYRAFTAKVDEMLECRGLSRVHQRIMFFVARYPNLSVKELLALLGVTKQALSIPLRQLVEMHLVNSVASENDKRKRLLELTDAGARFEQSLRREQVKLLERVFAEAGEAAVNGWLAVNLALGKTQMPGE